MLLKRISKHVKDRNRFAVGIDLVIGAVGVFVGLPVTAGGRACTDRVTDPRIARIEARLAAL